MKAILKCRECGVPFQKTESHGIARSALVCPRCRVVIAGAEYLEVALEPDGNSTPQKEAVAPSIPVNKIKDRVESYREVNSAAFERIDAIKHKTFRTTDELVQLHVLRSFISENRRKIEALQDLLRES